MMMMRNVLVFWFGGLGVRNLFHCHGGDGGGGGGGGVFLDVCYLSQLLLLDLVLHVHEQEKKLYSQVHSDIPLVLSKHPANTMHDLFQVA
jgi:hypothetical protein